jgi:hypothetical protein
MKINFDMENWLSGLNVFRDCFYVRSFESFTRYVTGIILSENKTVDGLNSVFVQKKDQSNINHLLTQYPWRKDNFCDEFKTLFKQHKICSSF